LKIFWIRGRYGSVIFKEKSSGGLVRTKYAQEMMKTIFPDSDIIDVVIKRPFRNGDEISGNYISLPLKKKQIVARTFFKIFRKIPLTADFGITASSFYVQVDGTKLLEELKKYRKNVVVIDSLGGYLSIRHIFDKLVKHSMAILYLSHNFEPEFTSLRIFRGRIEKIEKEIMNKADVIFATSMRDSRIFEDKYGISCRKIVVFPNIFPLEGLKLSKEKMRSVSLVVSGKWDRKYVEKMLEKLHRSILICQSVDKIIFVGPILSEFSRRKKWPCMVEAYDFIESRREFLETIGKAHIGLNFSFRLGGTNVRKYDYALTAQVVLSDTLGTRGDLLPHEYVFVDEYDLASKIDQIFDGNYLKMGKENALFAHTLYEKAKEKIKLKLFEMLGLKRKKSSQITR